MGLFKELMNAVENRLYGTGATATAKENNGVQMILIQTGKALQALYVGSILNEMAAGIMDAEEGAEQDILQNGIDISADVYKVAHHGSNTATSQAFLDAVHPTYAVISAGEGNSYGHPHAETLERLAKWGVSLYNTKDRGAVSMYTDGRKYGIQSP
mgnify:CR=1 FL=1